MHQLCNGPCHSGQALLSCVEVEPIFSLFLICLRVCGEPQKTAGATHSKDLLKIIDVGEQPDYEQCILVSMKASLNEMLAPGALAIFSSLIIDGSAQLDCEKCISMWDISQSPPVSCSVPRCKTRLRHSRCFPQVKRPMSC